MKMEKLAILLCFWVVCFLLFVFSVNSLIDDFLNKPTEEPKDKQKELSETWKQQTMSRFERVE